MEYRSFVRTPSQAFGRMKSRPEKLLFLCFYDPLSISTVPETAAYIQSNSVYQIIVMNMFEHRHSSGALSLSSALDLKSFDGIVIHNSFSYDVQNLRSLDRYLKVSLKDFDGIKVLMKQDENYRFKDMAEYIGDIGFDIVFTCLPEEAIELVYPEKLAGRPKFVRMLTGYVTPTLRNIDARKSRRCLDIGYRGSVQPLSFGRLAYEKRKIGDDLLEILDGRGFSLDISSRWEDRIGGDGWFQFLASCKATLGAESGASVFDLDGDLTRIVADTEKVLGPFSEDSNYAEAFLAKLAHLEGNVFYNQISPRHFEAAATRTLQIMYPGQYSGIFVAGRHYVEIERDYSNLEEVVDLLFDEKRRKEITECAYEEIIQSKKYWIETFVEKFDEQLSDIFDENNLQRRAEVRSVSPAKNIILLAAHEPHIDPRLGWISNHAPKPLRVVQVGVSGAVDCDQVVGSPSDLIFTKPRTKWSPGVFDRLMTVVGGSHSGMAGLSELFYLERLYCLSEESFCEYVGAPYASERVRIHFRWYLRYLLETSQTLLEQLSKMRGVHVIIATDLDTLPAALIAKGMFNAPIFYDAHEYWPESDTSGFEFEREFWVNLERRLVSHVDYAQTVSTGLATMMSEMYGINFHCVPNCEPCAIGSSNVRERSFDTEIFRFIFQGNFAPKRGLDLLIDAWLEVDDRAHLLLRGPDNEYKKNMIDLAKKNGLYDKRIFFPKAVDEGDLITALQDGDVGVIPYTPTGQNYRNCCPNKMSQYMAAKMPILANRTSYVESILTESDSGIIVDFLRAGQVSAAVSRFISNPGMCMSMAYNGYKFYKERFNWEVSSTHFYDNIISAVEKKELLAFEVYENISFPNLYRSKFEIAARKKSRLPRLTRVLDKSTNGSTEWINKELMCKNSDFDLYEINRVVLKIWNCVPVRLRKFLGPYLKKIVGYH